MLHRFSKFLDSVSDFLAHRKGLLPFTGVLLVAINAVLQYLPPSRLAETNLLLHLGVIIAILGIMLAWAL